MDTYKDFGALSEFGTHHFYVDIPRSTVQPISIFEDFGFSNDSNSELIEKRVILDRKKWAIIRDTCRKDFNARLKKKKAPAGKWVTGEVKMDRFLGMEICLLAWAIEKAELDECKGICQNWAAWRPEERWWFYTKIAAASRLPQDQGNGWRKSIYYALADKSTPSAGAITKKTTTSENEFDLFSMARQGTL